MASACVECRKRKVRCDAAVYGLPCSRCRRKEQQCVPADDKRSARLSGSEVEQLQEKVRKLERVVGKAKTRARKLGVERLVRNEAAESGKKYPKPSVYQTLFTEKKESEKYGATSIFDLLSKGRCGWGERGDCGNDDDSDDGGDEENDEDEDAGEFDDVGVEEMNKNSEILSYIRVFFQWLYPDVNMFVPRETFLIEFYHPRKDGVEVYCCKELVLVIAALGSLVSGEIARSRAFYRCGVGSMMKKMHRGASIRGVQVFLLAGLYDLYMGNLDACWMNVGIGIRMGLGVGFHLSNPSGGENEEESRSEKISVLFRSRIYWGCFVFEYLISLMFGRPSILQMETSMLGESRRVPDLEWITEGFNFKGAEIIEVAKPLRSMVRLIEIVERSMKKRGSGGRDGERDVEDVDAVLRGLQQWREGLDEELQWDRSGLQTRSLKPPDMIHIYFYYIVRLSFCSGGSAQAAAAGARADVVDVCESLSAFVGRYGPRRVSVLAVHAGMLAVAVGTRGGAPRAPVRTLLAVLEECGRGHGLRVCRRAARRLAQEVETAYGPAGQGPAGWVPEGGVAPETVAPERVAPEAAAPALEPKQGPALDSTGVGAGAGAGEAEPPVWAEWEAQAPGLEGWNEWAQWNEWMGWLNELE